jgi:rhodanese-related sulfurtransferase
MVNCHQKLLPMRITTSFSFLLLFVLGFVSCSQQTETGQLTPAVFAEKMKTAGVVVLDVRTIDEFNSGHIEGAKQLDYYETDSFNASIDALDKDVTYLLYCRSGGRSGTTYDMMVQKGFKNVYNLEGGMLAWQKANMPVVAP